MGTAAGIFNTIGGMSFTTTEVGTNIKVTANGAGVPPAINTATFTATELLSITTTGDEPGVGYIRMEALGFSTGAEYPWFDSTVDPEDNYSIGFVAQQDDIVVNIDNGRFIVENLVTAEVTPGPNGNLLMQANGADESGNGVTVESTDVTISSGDNVALRAENIYFNELISDVYVRPDDRPLTLLTAPPSSVPPSSRSTIRPGLHMDRTRLVMVLSSLLMFLLVVSLSMLVMLVSTLVTI